MPQKKGAEEAVSRPLWLPCDDAGDQEPERKTAEIDGDCPGQDGDPPVQGKCKIGMRPAPAQKPPAFVTEAVSQQREEDGKAETALAFQDGKRYTVFCRLRDEDRVLCDLPV